MLYLREGNPKCAEFVRKKNEYCKGIGLLEPWVESASQVSQVHLFKKYHLSLQYLKNILKLLSRKTFIHILGIDHI